jgi:hypothetical protein
VAPPGHCIIKFMCASVLDLSVSFRVPSPLKLSTLDQPVESESIQHGQIRATARRRPGRVRAAQAACKTRRPPRRPAPGSVTVTLQNSVVLVRRSLRPGVTVTLPVVVTVTRTGALIPTRNGDSR